MSNARNLSDLPAADYVAIFPVGAIYLTAGNINPGTFIGGTWTQIAQGRALVGVGTGTDANSATKAFAAGNDADGEYSHTLTGGEIPDNTLGDIPWGTGAVVNRAFAGHTGAATTAHNNVQPSFGIYIWQRTA